MTKVMRKEALHTQRRDRASGVPLEILEKIVEEANKAFEFNMQVLPGPGGKGVCRQGCPRAA